MNYNYYEKKFVGALSIEESRIIMLEAFHDDDITPKEYGRLVDKYIRTKPAPRSYELPDNQG